MNQIHNKQFATGTDKEANMANNTTRIQRLREKIDRLVNIESIANKNRLKIIKAILLGSHDINSSKVIINLADIMYDTLVMKFKKSEKSAELSDILTQYKHLSGDINNAQELERCILQYSTKIKFGKPERIKHVFNYHSPKERLDYIDRCLSALEILTRPLTQNSDMQA